MCGRRRPLPPGGCSRRVVPMDRERAPFWLRDADEAIVASVDRGVYRCSVSSESKIEWTDASWNPVRGCSKVSPGCKHCYAETFSERFRGVPDHPFERGFDLRLVPEKLAEPLRWAAPRTVFVNSMSDLFHEQVPTDYIRAVAQVMSMGYWHTYQVLTKRADRMADLLESELVEAASLTNVWWGVSVEDRKFGIPRIDRLRQTPANVKFLSIEPLLEDLGRLDLRGIDWVIVGGESGHGARAMKKEWVTSIRDQCLQRRVPFFFKQWGGVFKARSGRMLDGRTYDEMPQKDVVDQPGRAIRSRVREQGEQLAYRWTMRHRDQVVQLPFSSLLRTTLSV